MDFQISGKRALVTAASEGIGRGVAEQLHGEGARLGICGRDLAKLQKSAKEIPAEFYASCDLESRESVEEFSNRPRKMGLTRDFSHQYSRPSQTKFFGFKLEGLGARLSEDLAAVHATH